MSDLNFEKRSYSYLKATPPTMLARQMLTAELAERLKGTGIVFTPASSRTRSS